MNGHCGMRLMVGGNRSLRCIWFTDLGQRVEQWLPIGAWQLLDHRETGWAIIRIGTTRTEPDYYVSDDALGILKGDAR